MSLCITELLIIYSSGYSENSNGADFDFISGPEGSSITLEYPDGQKNNIGSDRVIGWACGQLLRVIISGSFVSQPMRAHLTFG